MKKKKFSDQFESDQEETEDPIEGRVLYSELM